MSDTMIADDIAFLRFIALGLETPPSGLPSEFTMTATPERHAAIERVIGTMQYAAFGRWALEQHRNDGEPSDVDGDDLQDKAIELGLLVYVPVTEPCGERCWCAEFHGEFPCECLRMAEKGAKP